jgi:hypothetical protein
MQEKSYNFSTKGRNLMKVKFVIVAVTMLMLLVCFPGAGGAFARQLASSGGTIPYAGQLNDDSSRPVPDGVYAFAFALYDDPVGGNLLWKEIQTSVIVKGGSFSTALGRATPLSPEVRTGKGWLAMSVQGPGESGFTALAPRQELNTALLASTPSLSAGPSCPHDHLGETWVWTTDWPHGLTINANSTNFGIAFHGIANNSTDSVAVIGESTGGWALAAQGHTRQNRTSGGWVKAMARVAGTNITRCFRGFDSVEGGTAASTPPCGFSSTGSNGTYTVGFGFQVNDRFISITPEWGSDGVPSAVVDSFPTSNQVKVRLSADSAFFIIVY